MEPNCAAAGSIRHGSSGSAVDWAVEGVEGKQSTDPPPFELCLPALPRSTSTSPPTAGPREEERPRPSTRCHAPHLGSAVDWDKGGRTAPRLTSDQPPRASASLSVQRRHGGREEARLHGRRSRTAPRTEIPRGASRSSAAGEGGSTARRPVWGGRSTARRRCVRGGRRAEGARNRPVGEPGRRRGGRCR
jgi:hypothetical protein